MTSQSQALLANASGHAQMQTQQNKVQHWHIFPAKSLPEQYHINGIALHMFFLPASFCTSAFALQRRSPTAPRPAKV